MTKVRDSAKDIGDRPATETAINDAMIEAVEGELAFWDADAESLQEKAIAVIKAVLANLSPKAHENAENRTYNR